MMRSKRLRRRLTCLVLALCFLLPMFATPATANQPVKVNLTVEGVTPDELDAMAIDPQTWRLPHDTRFNPAVLADGTVLNASPDWDGYESFVPFPVVDWEKVRQGEVDGPVFPAGLTPRVFRGTIILIEFPDRPLISSLPKGSEMMGNPQVESGVWGLKGEERGEALREFWRTFLNESIPELNRTHNITGGWLEYSAGQLSLDLEVYGPFMMPNFQFQYPSLGTWWDTGSASLNNFGNFDFRNQFSKAGNLAPAAAQIAYDAGVPFYDSSGNARFDFIFFTYAGYCQSPTWQEMGSMMFENPYRNSQGNPVNENGLFPGTVTQRLPTIWDTEVVVDPVTREVIEGVTGKDFTGWGHMQRLIDTVTAPGFDITVEWPDYSRSNIGTMWRNHVSTGTNATAFTAARTAFEGANVIIPASFVLPDGRSVSVTGTEAQRTVGANVRDAFAEWRMQFGTTPAITLRPDQFRDTIIRPAFLRQYAEDMKYVSAAPAFAGFAGFSAAAFGFEEEAAVPEITQADIGWIDGIPFYNGQEYTGDVSALPEFFLVAPEVAAWADEYIAGVEEAVAEVPQFAAFSMASDTIEREYSQMWLDFIAVNNHNSIVYGVGGTFENPATGSLLRLLYNAQLEAERSTVNPYYQAAPSRYVPWSSWYGCANVWSHASSLSVTTPWGSRTLSFSAQGEGSAMGVYSHELGHILRLPDNDNMVYQEIPVRAILGGWDMMARGAHVGYYGGHTRWNIPGIRAGSAGTGVMMRSRVASGFTDLTTRQSNGRFWVRNDHENSQDILYIPYDEFRVSPPIFAEIYGRNTPTNRGFPDAHGNPVEGYVGLVIENSRAVINRAYNTSGSLIANHGQRLFADQTPGINRPIFGTAQQNTIQTRWGNNLLGVDLNYPAPNTTPAVPLSAANGRAYLATLPTHYITGKVSIDPARWNWSIGGNVVNQTDSPTLANTGLNSGTNSQRHSGFTVEVVERTGHDSFAPDHGVVISRTAHMNQIGVGNMDATGTFIVDATPGNLGLVQFYQADGTPYMMWDDHHANISAAAFHAGVHNKVDYYRDIFPGRFHEMDNRPGVAGQTVNEWVDVPNNLHFYILGKNIYDGAAYEGAEFISYDVAVRSMMADAWKADGELELAQVAPMVPAKVGNFAKQTYALTNTGTDTDIVRITLDGAAADTVYFDEFEQYPASTKDQNAVLHNNLYAIGPGETIEIEVWVKSVTGFASDFDLTVKASSETNPDKKAAEGLTVIVDAEVTAYVTKLTGGTNGLTIDVVEFYDDGNSFLFKETFTIANNADGVYRVGGYEVFVSTRGNTDVREIRIVSVGLSADRTPPEVEEPGDAFLVSVSTSASSLKITGNNDWTLSFVVSETYSDGSVVSADYSVQVKKNSAGRVDLGDYTLIYDIAGNGSNIKDFRVVLN